MVCHVDYLFFFHSRAISINKMLIVKLLRRIYMIFERKKKPLTLCLAFEWWIYNAKMIFWEILGEKSESGIKVHNFWPKFDYAIVDYDNKRIHNLFICRSVELVILYRCVVLNDRIYLSRIFICVRIRVRPFRNYENDQFAYYIVHRHGI